MNIGGTEPKLSSSGFENDSWRLCGGGVIRLCELPRYVLRSIWRAVVDDYNFPFEFTVGESKSEQTPRMRRRGRKFFAQTSLEYDIDILVIECLRQQPNNDGQISPLVVSW